MNTQTELSTARPERPLAAARRQRPLDSAVLLGGHDEVEIVHQGETYRLRRTRQGKLILTK